jgi:hypothetical protein
VKPALRPVSARALHDLLYGVEEVERQLRRLAEETTIFSTTDGTVSARVERALRSITAIADRLFRLVHDVEQLGEPRTSSSVTPMREKRKDVR